MMLKKMLEKSVFFEKIEISFNILDFSSDASFAMAL